MMKSEKKLKELALLLSEKNNTLITEAIIQLRDEQPFKGVIGLLTSFYDMTDNNIIRMNIESFMNDLKDQSACPEVITEIKKPWKADTISMLVSSCWQSGLDFTEYSLDLAHVFLKGDYITALECLTVIEESIPGLSRERKDEMIKIIRENPHTEIKEKTALTNELIMILKR